MLLVYRWPKLKQMCVVFIGYNLHVFYTFGCNSSSLTYFSISAGILFDVRPLSLLKKYRCSLTVNSSNRMLCCGHSPKLSRTLFISVLILQPPTKAVPEVGGIIPVSIDIVVVFPAPLWPIIKL